MTEKNNYSVFFDELLKSRVSLKNTAKTLLTNFFESKLNFYLANLLSLEKKNKIQQDYFDQLTDGILEQGLVLEKEINSRTIINKVKKYFRKFTGPWAYRSLIVKRAYEKPRGYPGDYFTLEAIYNNQPITDKSDNIGYCFDVYFLKNPLAVGVRERKDKMLKYISDFINKKSNKINILNLASGAIREIRELSKEEIYSANYTCIDFDEEALNFSKNFVKDFKNFSFLNLDILKVIKEKNLFEKVGKQDLIYSIGLIDYLPERILKEFIKICYEGLLPGGRLILSHKDSEEHNPLAPAWFCDWNFYSRNKNDLRKIITSCNIPEQNLKIKPLSCKIIFSIFIGKP